MNSVFQNPNSYIIVSTAEQRLAIRIRSIINRVADDKSYSFAIINKEMAQPTRLLSDILEKEINPQRLHYLSDIQDFADHVVLFSLAGIQAIRSQTLN